MPRGELEERPLLDLSSGYIQRAIDQFPRQGDRGPWRVRQNYLLDSVTTLRRGLRRLDGVHAARPPYDVYDSVPTTTAPSDVSLVAR